MGGPGHELAVVLPEGAPHLSMATMTATHLQPPKLTVLMANLFCACPQNLPLTNLSILRAKSYHLRDEIY